MPVPCAAVLKRQRRMGQGAARLAVLLPSLHTLLISRTRVEDFGFGHEPPVPEPCLLAFATQWAELCSVKERAVSRAAALQQLELYRCDAMTPAVVAAMVQAQSE